MNFKSKRREKGDVRSRGLQCEIRVERGGLAADVVFEQGLECEEEYHHGIIWEISIPKERTRNP